MEFLILCVLVLHLVLNSTLQVCAENLTEIRQFLGLPNFEKINSDTSWQPMSLVIRDDLPGIIYFEESNSFWLNISITSEGSVVTSQVKTVYRMAEDNRTIILQVYLAVPEDAEAEFAERKDRVMFLIGLCVGGFVGACIFISLLIYCCYWKRRSKITDQDENIDENKGVPQLHTFSQKRKFYEARGQGTTAMMTLAVLAVCTYSVQAHLHSTTRVDIVVYFPRGFIRPDTGVFVNSLHQNEVGKIGTDLEFDIFDVPNAGLLIKDRCAKRNLTCENGGCDPMNGRCICPRGMERYSEAGRFRCVHKCHNKCAVGYFEQFPCNKTHQALCKKCRPLCGSTEYESTSCAGKFDRGCTDISKLPKINVSNNVVFENRLQVSESVKAVQKIFNYSDQYSIWLNRTSGLGLHIRVLQVDFSSTFQEVLHNVSDNSQLKTDGDVLKIQKELCQFPVPDYYEIKVEQLRQDVGVIKGTSTSCPNYDGKQKLPQKAGKGLYCIGSENSVLKLFGEDSNAEGLWKEEKTRACYESLKKCEICREECSISVRKDPVCSITSNDKSSKKEYGEHFTYCFDCCFQTSCACKTNNCPCQRYKTMNCLASQVTCANETEYDVSISPVFPQNGAFKCNLAPVRGPVFVLETSLWKNGKLIKNVETGERNKSRETAAKTSRDFGYLVLRHPSILQETINRDILIKGNIHDAKYAIGWYKRKQYVLSVWKKSSIYIQPTEPFGVNTETWPKQQCGSVNRKGFVILPSRDENFQEFANMTAEIDWEGRNRVYKVYNSTTARELEVEIPRSRSIFQHAFPETVILDDNTLTGELRRNQTSWIIRLSGRVTVCPGFFSVELTDQDRPQVKLFHVDLGIVKQICTFTMEFVLPTEENTEHIDKQFIAKLKDSQKTLSLTLVRPGLTPDLSIPDFEDEFDIEKLGVLIPVGSTTGGLIIALILILIYGYKTKPRDKYHRDRDNQLHLRHLLFVVWLVGMRLAKSFLVTLTVFSVILSAIHHTNIKTLQHFGNLCEKQEKIEKDAMNLMDQHKTQEIARQWALLQDGKAACETKLRDLESHLDRHYREMRRRQVEERRKKSIIIAAKDQVRTQFKHMKERFELKRINLNHDMDTYANQLNSGVKRLQEKVDNNFWLKAAHVMYDALDALAALFGGIKKPFIKWVGLHVNFHDVRFSFSSFDDIFKDFENDLDFGSGNVTGTSSTFSAKRILRKGLDVNLYESKLPKPNVSSQVNKERIQELLALEWIVEFVQSGVFAGILLLVDLLWFVYRHCKTYQSAAVLIYGLPKVYKLEKIRKDDEKRHKRKKLVKEGKKVDNEAKQVTKSSRLTNLDSTNRTWSGLEKSAVKKKVSIDQGTSIEMIEIIQPTEECNRGKVGTINEPNDEFGSPGEISDGSHEVDKPVNELPRRKAIHVSLGYLDRVNSILTKVLAKLRELNYQINNTDLVPMCVLIVSGLLCIYVVIVTAKYALNVETLETVGYFDLKLAPLLTMRKIVNTRITSNAFLANEVQIPYYQRRINTRIMIFKKKAKMYQVYQCATADLHNAEYCSWVGENCQGVGTYNEAFLRNLSNFECHIQPVIPRRFTTFDKITYKRSYKKAIEPYVSALRSLILDTFYMILVIMGISIVLKMFEIVTFAVLKKFDMIRQIKLYQTNYKLAHGEESVPRCLLHHPDGTAAKQIGPVEIPDAIKEKCGPAIREGACSVWADREAH